MSKLQGVKVLSAKQALAFVRLFTEGDTYYRFREPFAFEWLVNKAEVVQQTNAFVVTRQLAYPRDSAVVPIDVQGAGGGFPVYQVKETILPDGRYSCERLGLIDWVKERDLDIQRIQ
jgi:hypothetical protein